MVEMVFNCYDNGEFFMKGTAKQIATELDIPCSSTINTYAITKARYHRRYTFVFTGERVSDKVPENDKPRPLTKHEQKLEYLKWHLLHYGNTTIKGDPGEYIDELSAMEIEIQIHRSIYSKKDYILERI